MGEFLNFAQALSQWLLSRIPGLLEGNPAKDSAVSLRQLPDLKTHFVDLQNQFYITGPPREGPIPIPSRHEATPLIIHQWASALFRSKLGWVATTSSEGRWNDGQFTGGLWSVHSCTSVSQVWLLIISPLIFGFPRLYLTQNIYGTKCMAQYSNGQWLSFAWPAEMAT